MSVLDECTGPLFSTTDVARGNMRRAKGMVGNELSDKVHEDACNDVMGESAGVAYSTFSPHGAAFKDEAFIPEGGTMLDTVTRRKKKKKMRDTMRQDRMESLGHTYCGSGFEKKRDGGELCDDIASASSGATGRSSGMGHSIFGWHDMRRDSGGRAGGRVRPKSGLVRMDRNRGVVGSSAGNSQELLSLTPLVVTVKRGEPGKQVAQGLVGGLGMSTTDDGIVSVTARRAKPRQPSLLAPLADASLYPSGGSSVTDTMWAFPELQEPKQDTFKLTESEQAADILEKFVEQRTSSKRALDAVNTAKAAEHQRRDGEVVDQDEADDELSDAEVQWHDVSSVMSVDPMEEFTYVGERVGGGDGEAAAVDALSAWLARRDNRQGPSDGDKADESQELASSGLTDKSWTSCKHRSIGYVSRTAKYRVREGLRGMTVDKTRKVVRVDGNTPVGDGSPHSLYGGSDKATPFEQVKLIYDMEGTLQSTLTDTSLLSTSHSEGDRPAPHTLCVTSSQPLSASTSGAPSAAPGTTHLLGSMAQVSMTTLVDDAQALLVKKHIMGASRGKGQMPSAAAASRRVAPRWE